MIDRIVSEKYRIIEKIGSGGMADVYKAVQIGSSQRIVALKALKKEYEQDAAFLRRFDTEARAVLGLSHDNIVRFYDVGQDGDLNYLVFEYVGGRTLKEEIKKNEGGLPLRTLINYGAQVLDALSHAHEKGVIHRDIKPQNIIINPKGRAKLADFGIARMADTDNTLTFAGTNVLGSVHYVSPEQAKGLPVTLESDLYSMGVALYEMATGQVPFEGENSVAVALKHVQEDMLPPICLKPGLPTALNDIIIKATQKNPALRYNSAKEMRRDLMRVLRDPNGAYARLERQDDVKAAPKKQGRRKSRKLIRLWLSVLSLLAALFGIFFAGQQILQSLKSDSLDLVPNLVGKTVEEATDIARLREYVIVIAGVVKSSEYESGLVADQKPQSPEKLEPGSTIEIIVSEGTGELTYAPDLTGHTLFEAEALLKEAGLAAGNIDYRASEHPAGLIYNQEPSRETELFIGDSVDIFISGTPDNTLETPDVLNKDLQSALALLSQRGLESFIVRREKSAEAHDQVVYQNPAQGEPVERDGTIELKISTPPEGYAYEALLPITLDVEKDYTRFCVVIERDIEGVKYKLVLFEAELKKGQRRLQCELTLDLPGTQELLLLLDGQEYQRLPVSFN